LGQNNLKIDIKESAFILFSVNLIEPLSYATIKLFIKEIIKNNRLKIINNIFLLFFFVVKNFKITSNGWQYG